MTKIRFQFSGGMADKHEMNFYEAGRFQYAAARLIYTLEKFRQEGKVVSRLSTKINADIRVKAAQQGSYVQEIAILALPLLQDPIIKCSLEAILAYAWQIVLPNPKGKDIALEIAKQEVERQKQHTEQEKEKTKQMQCIESVANKGFATTTEALAIIKNLSNNQSANSNQENLPSIQEINAYTKELLAHQEREQIIQQNQQALDSISPETERRLAGQIRKTVNDIVLPLKSSATDLNISGGSENFGHIVHLDQKTATAITQISEDENSTLIRGAVKSYDRENGYGKFRYRELPHPISFRIPNSTRKKLQGKILDAMKKDNVLLKVYFFRDGYKNPISLVVEDVLPNEQQDSP